MKTFKFANKGLEFKVDVEGRLALLKSDGRNEQQVVKGVALDVLEFVDSVLANGFRIRKFGIDSHKFGSVVLRAGEFNAKIASDGYLVMELLQKNQRLRFSITKYEVEIEFITSEYVKNFVEEGDFRDLVMNLGLKYRLVASAEDLIYKIDGDRLVVETKYGNVFAEFTPWDCRLYFVVGCGLSYNGNLFYEWVYNSLVKHKDRIIKQKVGEGEYVFKLGLFEIYCPVEWYIQQIHYDGEVELWLNRDGMRMLKNDRVLLNMKAIGTGLDGLTKIAGLIGAI